MGGAGVAEQRVGNPVSRFISGYVTRHLRTRGSIRGERAAPTPQARGVAPTANSAFPCSATEHYLHLIPPTSTRREAEDKADELRRSGVSPHPIAHCRCGGGGWLVKQYQGEAIPARIVARRLSLREAELVDADSLAVLHGPMLIAEALEVVRSVNEAIREAEGR